MRIARINPADDARWDAFVSDHPEGSVFHHSDWQKVIQTTFSQVEPLHVAAENSDGELQGVLPLYSISSRITGKRLVSIPFSLYCEAYGR